MVMPCAPMVMSRFPVQKPRKQLKSKVQLTLQRCLEICRQIEFLALVD